MNVRSSIFLILFFPGVLFAQSASLNGFTLSNLLIPRNEIFRGGPPKDGIPSIDRPAFISAGEATFLQADDRVIGITFQGITKAYPIRIMDRHEVVNDFFGDLPVAITYCPLCRSGVAFLAQHHGENKTFGVSGLLYNSDVLLYDRETESLWSQIMNQAVSGKESGAKLTMLPLQHTTWEEWKTKNPNSLVLSMDTGFRRSYDSYAYERYEATDELMFPVKNKKAVLPNKALVIGIEINGQFKAYPFKKLQKLKGPLADTFNGKELIVHYNKLGHSATITDESGKVLVGTTMYWFAWQAFHPDTEVFRR